MRAVTVGILAAVAGGGCASSDVVGPPAPVVAMAEKSVALTEHPDRWRHDRYEFLSARIEGDVLHVQVQHGGGCTTHDFTLLISPIFMESYPVQMSGSLAHDAKGDPCRALVGSTLHFDLSPIKHLYRQSYGVQSDTIHLRIAGWPERVSYTF
jgi:hypothetical protein